MIVLMTNIMHAERKELGLTPNEFCFLNMLHQTGVLIPYQKFMDSIAEDLCLPESEIKAMVKKLLAEGFLRRDDKDELFLTQKFTVIYGWSDLI